MQRREFLATCAGAAVGVACGAAIQAPEEIVRIPYITSGNGIAEARITKSQFERALLTLEQHNKNRGFGPPLGLLDVVEKLEDLVA